MKKNTLTKVIAAAAVLAGYVFSGNSPFRQAAKNIRNEKTEEKSQRKSSSGTSGHIKTETGKVERPEADFSSLIASKSQRTIKVNKDKPYFASSQMTKKKYIRLSDLDGQGRCGAAMMCAYYTGIADAERGNISSIHPTGWKQAYVRRNGKSYALYNRSHLLMYKLTGLNDNKQNLITGTEYFNQQLMLSVESQVLDYVRASKEHVMYRVTPVYKGGEQVARGVLMEAKSVESDSLSLCRYVPNIEPGVSISYATGKASSSSSSVSVRQA